MSLLDQQANFRKQQGQLLRKARKSTTENYSQSDVATILGLSQDTVSMYERGQQDVTSYRLLEFAKIYNKPVTFFYMTNTSEFSRSEIPRESKHR